MRHGETYEPQLATPMASAAEDPDLPLTDRGRAQAEAVAKALAGVGLDGAVASPFRRSRETAAIVAGSLGLAVETVPALIELALHPPPGGTLRDVARRYLALARDLETHPPERVPLDDGRDLGSALAGALDALHDALARCGPRVLVVAHGGLNRFVLAHWLGIPPHGFLGIDQDFGCVNVIDFVLGGRPWVRAVNVTLYDPFKGEGPVGTLGWTGAGR
jgi:broad specificity phosphatase PhoE